MFILLMEEMVLIYYPEDKLKTALMVVKAQTICWVVSIVTLFLGEMEKIILTVGPETTK